MLTRMGRITYQSMRRDDTNALVLFLRLYLFPISSYRQKTIRDLR